MIYDKPVNESLERKTEMAPYNAALIITGAYKGTLHDRIYQELVGNLWQIKKDYKTFFFLHKIIIGWLLSYFMDYLIVIN